MSPDLSHHASCLLHKPLGAVRMHVGIKAKGGPMNFFFAHTVYIYNIYSHHDYQASIANKAAIYIYLALISEPPLPYLLFIMSLK